MIEPSPDDAADIYVPGAWKCPACAFVLTQATLFVQSGEVGSTLDQVMRMTGESCPNDGTPMLRVTWRERAEENRVWGESLMHEIIAIAGAEHLPGALMRLRELLAGPRYTAEQLAEKRQHCMSMQAFLRRKGTATSHLRDATTYAEIAAVIDAYLEALEQLQGGGR